MTRCWCGSSELTPFGDGYLECEVCGTLVRAEPPADDLYGRNYWYGHQAALGLPDLDARARADLGERCLHWLDAVLRYRPPPGRALELGAAHGGFTALLGWAGYDATGLELDPWVADHARRLFGVAMLTGPLEAQDLDGPFDLVAAMDVLEHLPDPLATVTRAAGLLAGDGALVLQTPCRRPGRDLRTLRDEGDRFVEMLLPEHLHLFTEESVRELLGRAGLSEVVFLPALFAHYDMFLIASRRPLAEHGRDEIRGRLEERPPSRLVATLLDLRAAADDQIERQRRLEELERAYRQADEDRTERQRQIEELERAYRQADTDRTERQRQIEELERAYRQADTDRTERQRRIEELEEAYRQADTDRNERQRRIEELDEAYRQADTDRTERQRRIEELEEAYRQADTDRTERQRRIEELEEAYRQADTDRTERQRRIEELDEAYRQADEDRNERQRRIEELERAYRQADVDRVERQHRIDELEETVRRAEVERDALRGDVEALEEALERERRISAERLDAAARFENAADRLEAERADLDRRHHRLRGLVLDHRNSRVYRAMVGLGRWRAHDERVLRALGERRSRADPPPRTAARREVAWGFTSVPAGAPRDAPIAVDLTALLPGGENGGAKLVATSLVRAFARLAPERRFVLLTSAACHDELAALEAPNVHRRRTATDPAGLAELLAGEPFALVFCPMTAPPWSDPRSPLVCLVHDLQYLTYPEHFDDVDRGARDDAFRRAVHGSDRVVTVSEYVRGTVLEHSGLPDDRVVAIHDAVAASRPEIAEDVDAVLARHGLEREGYFLYPANFWPHKNHRMLLVAFGQLHRRHPELKLVLTGAERPDPAPLVEAIDRMGLADAVRVAGYVPDAELAALLDGCRALVFPSLYEGFGMPVAEALARGRPVACSRVTALPEVAGDAAVYFDPRRPAEIADVLGRLARGEGVEELRRRGPRRAREIGDLDSMARAYLAVFDEVLASPRAFDDRLAGLHDDGWTPRRVVVSHAAGRRELELGLANPRDESVSVELRAAESHRDTLAPRESLVVRAGLPAAGGYLELDVVPTFCPRERGFSTDPRQLGLELWSCRIDGVDLLARSPDG